MERSLNLAKVKERIFTFGFIIFLIIILMLTLFIYNNNKANLLKEKENYFLDKKLTLESVLSKNIDITIILKNIFDQYSKQKISTQRLISLSNKIKSIKKTIPHKNYFTIPSHSSIENFTTVNTFISSATDNELSEKYIQTFIATLHLQDFQKSAQRQIKSLVASYYLSFVAPNNVLSIYPNIPADKILAKYKSFTAFTDEALLVNIKDKLSKHKLPKKNKNYPYFWSQPYLDPAGNGMMVSCSIPIYKNNQLNAIIGTDITLNILNNYIDKNNSSVENNYIISPRGYVIAGYHVNYKKNDDLILFDDLLIKKGGKSKFIITQKYFKNVPWKFVSLISKEKLLSETLTKTRYYNLFFLLSIFSSLIGFYYIRKNFIRPGILAAEKLQQSNIELNNTAKELKEKIIDLQEAQQKIIEAKKLASLATLVTGIAHEINTPAGIAITANSLIHEKTFELQQAFNKNKISKSFFKKYLDHISQSSDLVSENLNRVAELIKDFRYISASSSEYKATHFNFKDYLYDITSIHKDLYKKHGHTIKIYCHDITIKTYKNIFNRIILTLIENSIRHAFHEMENGLIEITFSEQKDHYQLIYKDNGCGIQGDNLDKIFDPFYTSARGQGKGLGLFGIHNIIHEALHGDIVMTKTDSENGVCFIITWPKKSYNK